MNRAVAGLIAGAIATAPMTLVMLAGRRRLPWYQRRSLPPHELTQQMLRVLHVKHQLSRPQQEAAFTAAHLGYGSAMGAAYGLCSSKLPGPGWLKGMGFGLGIWAASYAGWIPAAGLRPSAGHETRERNLMMIAAHVVWGGVTGLLTDLLSRWRKRAKRQVVPLERPKISREGEKFDRHEVHFAEPATEPASI
jgi:uncharacterized membrane protein YagU involved in acid resistance